jgi:tetratricopeptide (TPR) repeat protein
MTDPLPRVPMFACRARFVFAAILLLLSGGAPPARAGDVEECGTAAGLQPGATTIESVDKACTALIDNADTAAPARLTAYVNRSHLQVHRGKLDLALADAEKALQIDSQSPLALIQRGFVYQRMSKFDLASNDINRAIELAPQNAVGRYARGSLRNAQQDWPGAIADFSEALTMRQDFYIARIGRGIAYLQTGQVDSALADLNAAVAIDGTVRAYQMRGEAYRHKGDLDHAIEDFSRAIALSAGKDAASVSGRATAWRAKGDYDRALADYDAALALVPGNTALRQQRDSTKAMQAEMAKTTSPAAKSAAAAPPTPAVPAQSAPATAAPQAAPGAVTPQSLTMQAQQLYNQRKLGDALPLVNRALALEPMNGPAMRLRLQIYLASHQVAAAMTDLDGLLMTYPNDSGLICTRALLLAMAGHSEQALEDLARVQGAGRTRPEFYLAEGAAHLRGGHYADAINELTRATELKPSQELAFNLRGQAYLLSGDADKGLSDFDHGLSLNPADDNARAWRGLVLITKGQTAEGEADVNRVLERYPNDRIAGLGRCVALVGSGQFDRAIPILSDMIAKPAADDAALRTLRARAYIARGRHTDALADLDRVLLGKPDDADALMLRGMAHTALKDPDDALADLDSALKQRETVEGYLARAKAYEQKKELPRAIADLRRATELSPKRLFDIVAQTEARLHMEQLKHLDKLVPCSSGPSSEGTCL